MTTAARQRRDLSGLAAGVAAAVYAFAALASGLDRLGADDPVLAGMLPSAVAVQSLRNQASNAQSIGESDKALQLARAAVRRAPIEPSSTAILGAALLGKQDEQGADQAFRVAAQMGWRVPLTQLYWMQTSLAYGDYPNAAIRLDALLRQQPALIRDRKLLDPLERSEEGRAALAARLVERPDWLPPYSIDVWNTAPDVLELRRAVLLDMARDGASLGCVGISQFVQREIDIGNVRGAHEVWSAHCPSARDALVYDGEFSLAEVAQTRASLAWTFVGNAGISVMLEPGARPGTRALAVDGTVQRPKVFVRQLMLLQPGTYRVNWTATTDDGAPSARVVVGFECGKPVEWQQGVVATGGRRTAILDLAAPCETPWLSFALAPGAGTARITAVKLAPAGKP